jgi:hypothetical protein
LLKHYDAKRKREQQAAHDDDQKIIGLACGRGPSQDTDKKRPRARLRTWPGCR